MKADIDHLVLGCSHYPFIISILKKILGEKVNIIDSGYAVAKQTKRILKRYHLETKRTKPNIDKINIFNNGTSISALNTVIKELQLKDFKIVV